MHSKWLPSSTNTNPKKGPDTRATDRSQFCELLEQEEDKLTCVPKGTQPLAISALQDEKNLVDSGCLFLNSVLGCFFSVSGFALKLTPSSRPVIAMMQTQVCR